MSNNQTLIQLSKNIVIDAGQIASAKRIVRDGFSSEPIRSTQIVLQGSPQVYEYQGSEGDALWSVILNASIPAYSKGESE